MDDKRDIQRSNPLFRFFDKQTVHVNPFGPNQTGERAYRRAERIVAALFLVTNHIPSGESLRSAVRVEALQLLERILSLKNEMRTESRNVVECRVSIRHQISLIRMLAVAGFISMQNTNIMIEGLDELGSFLNASQNSPLSESVPLSAEGLKDITGSSIKDILVVKDKSSIKDTVAMSDMTSIRRNSHVREESIVSVLRSGGELGLRDIASHLPEYSEKMIQRHLVELIATGRVKKTGLKRWSRYSIVA